MKELYLSNESPFEENILAIINFVKDVEKEHGLTEEQIIFKYTCGQCKKLAEMIVGVLQRIYGNYVCSTCVTVEEKWDKGYRHYYIRVEEDYGQKIACYDILGKKSSRKMKAFMQSGYWDKIDYSKFPGLLGLVTFKKTDYVFDACDEFIKPKAKIV